MLKRFVTESYFPVASNAPPVWTKWPAPIGAASQFYLKSKSHSFLDCSYACSFFKKIPKTKFAFFYFLSSFFEHGGTIFGSVNHFTLHAASFQAHRLFFCLTFSFFYRCLILSPFSSLANSCSSAASASEKWWEYDGKMMGIWRKYDGNMMEIWWKYDGNMTELLWKYDGNMTEIWRKYDGCS